MAESNMHSAPMETLEIQLTALGKKARKERQSLRPSGLKWLSIFKFILDNREIRLLRK